MGKGTLIRGEDEGPDMEGGGVLFIPSNERCQVWLSVAVQQRCSILHVIFLGDRFN